LWGVVSVISRARSSLIEKNYFKECMFIPECR
jgi:hypothetical protein